MKMHFKSISPYHIRIIGSLLIGIILLSLSIGSYFYIRFNQREAYYLQASHAYENWLQALKTSTSSDWTKQGNEIIKHYPNTPYQVLTQLKLAQQAVHAKQLQQALNYLLAVVDHAKDPQFQAIARQRAARLLITMRQFEKALTLIDHKTCEPYTATCEEIKGDIFLAQGDKKKAFQAYQMAKAAVPNIEDLHPLLQMKLDDLGNIADAIPLQ